MTDTVLRIKKLDDRAIVPTYGTQFSAGADLYALTDGELEIKPHETKLVKTGLSMEIPVGTVGLIYARSGLASKRNLAPANKVGVIDSDYRGEIMVALHNHGETAQTISSGERIAQFVLTPYITANFEVVESLSDTIRGEGGFGSTGSK